MLRPAPTLHSQVVWLRDPGLGSHVRLPVRRHHVRLPVQLGHVRLFLQHLPHPTPGSAFTRRE